MQRHYKKAPITEAIIDLKVTLPAGITIDQLNDIRPSIIDKFPIVEPFYQGVGELTFRPGETFSADTSQQQIGFWFRSEDNLRTFQARLDGFSFNQLAPYESWEKLSDEAKSLWELYKEICKPLQVTRAAIRYINQINIPVDGLVELKDYLRVIPEVSPGLPQRSLQAFFMQLQIPQQDLDCMLIVNEAIAPPTIPDFLTILLDFDLFRQQIWDSNDENIWHFLEELRHRKNEVFEASITDKTRELIS